MMTVHREYNNQNQCANECMVMSTGSMFIPNIYGIPSCNNFKLELATNDNAKHGHLQWLLLSRDRGKTFTFAVLHLHFDDAVDRSVDARVKLRARN